MTSAGIESTVSGSASTRGQGTGRYASLDGLRGVAAVVVLVFHVMLISPVFDGASDAAGTALDGWAWALAHTPLHIVWLGTPAVFVFFVLSGFVLALPAASGRLRWSSYFPKRLLRLYPPVWASLAFALLLASLFPRRADPTRSDWLNAHAPGQGLEEAALDGLLLLGTGWLNSPLWSLRWEVLFSLLLPAYVLGAVLLRRFWVAKLVAVLLLIGAFRVLAVDTAFYLSMFALGVLLAYHRGQLAEVATWLSARPRAVWPGLGALCLLLLTARPMLLGLGPLDDLERGVARTLQLAGAVLAVFLALHWRALERLLSSDVVQWVGVRSFSLYLVHEPIVVSLAVALPALGVPALLALGFPLCLLAAHLFHWFVEGPSQRAAARAGRLLGPRQPQPVG